MAIISSYTIREILGDYSGQAFVAAMRDINFPHEKRLEKVPRYDNKTKKHSATTTIRVNYYDLEKCLDWIKPSSVQVARVKTLMKATKEAI